MTPIDPVEGANVPVDADEPVFAEPWEAGAFALAVHLAERGSFAWSEWAERLGAEIGHGPPAGAGPASAYYRHWLDALERICLDKGLVRPEEVGRRVEAWRRAYLATPHGHPVELAAAGERAEVQRG